MKDYRENASVMPELKEMRY